MTLMPHTRTSSPGRNAGRKYRIEWPIKPSRVDLASGNVLEKGGRNEQYFAEGVTIFKGRIFQLTWKAGKGLFTINDV